LLLAKNNVCKYLALCVNKSLELKMNAIYPLVQQKLALVKTNIFQEIKA